MPVQLVSRCRDRFRLSLDRCQVRVREEDFEVDALGAVGLSDVRGVSQESRSARSEATDPELRVAAAADTGGLPAVRTTATTVERAKVAPAALPYKRFLIHCPFLAKAPPLQLSQRTQLRPLLRDVNT